MTTYRDRLVTAMTRLGADPRAVFVGYNVALGRFGNTLSGVREEQLLEMPLAENLMVGAAIGMSLDGLLPVVCFERMDFITCAMDAIVNHLDKLAEISDGQHRPGVILRIVVGNRETPLFSGPTHVQNLSAGLRRMVSFPVIELKASSGIGGAYEAALARAQKGESTALCEFKDLYNEP